MVYTYPPEEYGYFEKVKRYVDVVERENASGVNFRFGKKGLLELKGKVFFNGEPVENAKIVHNIGRIVWDSVLAVSDENGNFEITGLKKGQRVSYTHN